ncbi:hypothetical protein VPH35_047293 [Triticum aestivum]
MEGNAQPLSACVSKMLDDGNLLTEVIVRVGFPISCVCAAGVRRRWLSHASDRAFLRRFREFHPPTLLGFYLALRGHSAAYARFFPMPPQPPEPTAIIRRENFSLDTHRRAHHNMMMGAASTEASSPSPVLVDNKIYMVNSPKEIDVLDLKASILSTIQLPHGVSIDQIGTTLLSRADDGSGLYLIHIKELQLQIWLYNGDNWLLVDTICFSEICASLFEDEPTTDIRINHVGDYTEFVFLEMGRCALYLDVKCRTLHKVYEMTANEFHLGDIYPFMTSWPPIFPALMDIPARECLSYDGLNFKLSSVERPAHIKVSYPY